MTDDLLQKKLEVAQAQLLLENMKIHNVAALLVATLVFIFLFQAAYKPVLIPWYILIMLAVSVRLFLVFKFQKYSKSEIAQRPIVATLAAITLVCGCLWGALSVMFIGSGDSTINFIILMLYTGLLANASVSLGSDLRVYLALIIPILLPTIFKLFTLPDPLYQWLGSLLIVYSAVGIVATENMRVSLKRSNILHIINGDLINNLQAQNYKTQAALAKAEQASIAKSRFFAAANHDLRQPLQSLSMFTTTLSSQTESTHQKKIVSYIDKSVRSLESLFNRLLDVSTLDAGTLKVRKRHLRLQPFIQELATEYVDLAKSRGLSFDVNVDQSIVYTDPILLGRVVRNLIENAVNYTNTGGIEISATAKDDQVQLSIIDSGIGISIEKQEQVYEEFIQLNNPSRDRNKGLGLGLSIVRRCCELLDLPLNLESSPSVGTVFTIDLPIGDSEQIQSSDVSDTQLAKAIEGMFVLIIDDEEDIRISMESLLSVWGCTVMVASSGQEAAQQLVEFESIPDAIITDYRLQDNETGADVLKSVREHCGQNIPAIIITADTLVDRLVEIDNLGVPLLHKPCNSSELLELLISAKNASYALASAS